MARLVKHFFRVARYSLFVGIIGVFLVSTINCASVKRKFVRKKKEKKEEDFIPVLEPIDYAPAMQSPQEKYRYHYSLWRVWEKELLYDLSGIEEKTSPKRRRHLLTQMIAQMYEMDKLLQEVKSQELKEMIRQYSALEEEIKRINLISGKHVSVLRKLERHSKLMRNQFTPNALRDEDFKEILE